MVDCTDTVCGKSPAFVVQNVVVIKSLTSKTAKLAL